jgi:hypothetical protein
MTIRPGFSPNGSEDSDLDEERMRDDRWTSDLSGDRSKNETSRTTRKALRRIGTNLDSLNRDETPPIDDKK